MKTGKNTMIPATSRRGTLLVVSNMLFRIGASAMIGSALSTAANGTLASLSALDRLVSIAASSWTFARKVRLPGALPFVFTGLRQASSLAVIAAVVAEYFGGLQNGLGSRITSAASFTAYPRAWAFVVGACLLGLVFYLSTLLLERLVMPWKSRLIT